MSIADKITFLPDGREALMWQCQDGRRITRRMARAAGALHWDLPNKAMCDCWGFRLPDWPPDVEVLVVTRAPIAPALFPCHDPSPLRRIDGRRDVGPTSLAMNCWEAFANA